jgi:hypothetical protein
MLPRQAFWVGLLIWCILLGGSHAVPLSKRQAEINVHSTALVIAVSDDAAEEAVNILDQFGHASQVLVVPQEGTALPTLVTVNGPPDVYTSTWGSFDLIIVIGLVSYDYGGTTGWASALTSDQWNDLYAYQTEWGVRMIHLDGYPGNFPGTAVTMGPAGGCCDDPSEEQYVSLINPLWAPNGTVPTLSTVGLWHYPATITDFNTTSSFITFGTNQLYSTNSVAGVIQNLSGREQMVFFLTGATWSATTNYLGQIWYRWGFNLIDADGIIPPTYTTALVIATDEDAAAEALYVLNMLNKEYVLFTVPQNGTELPPLEFTDLADSAMGLFGAIIVVSLAAYDYGGTTSWASAITSEQWEVLHNYQAIYRVRMIHLDGYPGNFEGVTTAAGPVGCCSTDDQYVYAVDPTVLPAGQSLSAFNDSVQWIWHYPAEITDSSTTSAFLNFAPNAEYSTSTVAGVVQDFGGIEQMVFFFPMPTTWDLDLIEQFGSIWITWAYANLYSPSGPTPPTSTAVLASAVASARASASANPITAFTTAYGGYCIPNGYMAQYDIYSYTPSIACAYNCSITSLNIELNLVYTPGCLAFFSAEIGTAPDYEFLCLLFSRDESLLMIDTTSLSIRCRSAAQLIQTVGLVLILTTTEVSATI